MNKSFITNKFTLAYTLFHPDDSLRQPEHKKISFEFESDMLGALDHALCKILDSNPGMEVIARSITFDNAREYYNEVKPMHGDKDE